MLIVQNIVTKVPKMADFGGKNHHLVHGVQTKFSILIRLQNNNVSPIRIWNKISGQVKRQSFTTENS